MLSDDSDASPSKKSSNSSVEISESPRRNEQILPNFDFILPKYHLILPKFYFVPTWIFQNFHVRIETSPCRDARSVRPSPLKHDAVTFDTTDAQTVRPYRSRIAVLQRTHRPCVPTKSYTYHCYRSRVTRHALTQRMDTDTLPPDTILIMYPIRVSLVGIVLIPL